MKKMKFKRAIVVIARVFVRLCIIALTFIVGCAISNVLYENCDWWYSDEWMFGAVLAGLQTLHYMRAIAKRLDFAEDNITDEMYLRKD